MNSYFEHIEKGARDLTNKAYFSAIEHFRDAKSVFGLEAVISELKKEKVSRHIAEAQCFAIQTYENLAGNINQE